MLPVSLAPTRLVALQLVLLLLSALGEKGLLVLLVLGVLLAKVVGYD